MFILLHWYCHRGFGCGKMITFTLKIFNIFGDVYTRDGTISFCQRDASAQIVVSHNYPTQVLGSIPFTPSVVTKWHDRHRYLSIHHVPYPMSLSSPRHCSKTLSKCTANTQHRYCEHTAVAMQMVTITCWAVKRANTVVLLWLWLNLIRGFWVRLINCLFIPVRNISYCINM